MSAARARSRSGDDRLGARRSSAPSSTWLAAPLLLLLATASDAQRLPVNTYDADDGLSGTQVWDLHQDRRGLLWAATTWGFSSFDGARFTVLSLREGLPSPNARTVVEDHDGNLWFGTNDGVARFDGRTVTSFAGRPQAPRSTIWSSEVDAAGRVWFGSADGLVRWSNGEFRRFGRADGLADDYIYAVLAARDGALWLGSRGAGLTRCAVDAAGDLDGCRIWTRADGLGADIVRALAEDAQGRILVGTRGGGVTIVDGEALSAVRSADGLAGDDVYALLVRANGQVVVGSADRGLALCLSLAPTRCRTVGAANGLPEDGVRSLLEDREGSLWIGTEGGLAQLVREDMWSYGEEEGLAGQNVYALAVDGDRGLWVGTFSGLTRLGVGRHGEPTALSFGRESGLPGRWVWALLADRRGEVWVGTEAGLCRMRGSRCESPAELGALATAYVLGLAEDRDGDVWAGTTDGVFRLRRDAAGAIRGVERFTAADGLADSRTYAVAGDAEGRVWLAHGEGLSVHEAGAFRDLAGDGPRAWESARGLGLDLAGRVLVGSYGALARLESAAGEPRRWRRWERVAELAGRMVLTLSESDQGRLLLGTSQGVMLFDPEARGGAGAVLAHVDSHSGAIATEVSHTSAFARDGQGRAWFGFKGGLTGTLGPLLATPPAPRLMIARLESKRGRVFAADFTEVGATPVGWLEAGRPQLPHDDRSLRVWVSAPTFVRRDDLRFQFRLAGADAEWSAPRAEPFRDLMNLDAGRHRLEARAAYTDGPWGEPAAADFEIGAAWWQTPFVPYALGALGLGSLALAARWRVRRIARLEGELEQRIAQRTEDLARYATAMGEHLRTVDRVSDRARRAEQVRRDLFARASHELRTPLTAVLGFSELLERSLGDRLDDKERRYLTHVRESGELLLRQVNEVLEHFRLESGRVEVHLEEVSLDGLLASVASLMEGFALHRGVHLAVRVEGETPAARADVAKLRQVLMNLLSNAIKYSPAGETVDVVLRPLAPGQTPWRRAAYEIEVRDHGPGIPPAELDTIFEPYRRLAVSSAVPGTGLGLSIARQIVTLLGGTLTVESQLGAGAAFFVRLPADPDPVSPLALGFDSGGYDAERAQVLVVEPDWARFAELTRGLASDGVLAVRVESVDALPRALGTLRPQALVVPFDPAPAAARDLVATAVAAARDRGVPLVLLPGRGGRARVLAIARVVGADAGEGEMRLALRAAGAAPRSFGRRPLLLVAAPREVGVALGATLSSAGCDHFRVEGAAEARAALAETAPDAGLVDLAHAFGLAADASPRITAAKGRVLGWILLDVGVPGEAAFAELAASVAGFGSEPGELLRATVAPMLSAPEDARGTAAPVKEAGETLPPG
jgi:signal transduction histidine kinase/ligand-binding sensor domain-containing protein